MAHGKHYSAHQKGIIKRYYDNKEHIMNQKLGEIVSELYMVGDEFKRRRLWQRAEKALRNLGIDEAEVTRLVESRDTKALAKLVSREF